jgi:hypothetical protein
MANQFTLRKQCQFFKRKNGKKQTVTAVRVRYLPILPKDTIATVRPLPVIRHSDKVTANPQTGTIVTLSAAHK